MSEPAYRKYYMYERGGSEKTAGTRLPMARKWVARYRAEGEQGLMDCLRHPPHCCSSRHRRRQSVHPAPVDVGGAGALWPHPGRWEGHPRQGKPGHPSRHTTHL